MMWMTRLLGGLVLLVVLALGGAYFYIDTIIKTGIEKGGTYALGVDTRVGSVRMGLLDGKFGLSDLSVANPTGFEGDRFFELSLIDVDVSLGSLREQVVRVPLIALDGVSVTIEKTSRGGNYDVILANLKKLESGEAPVEDEGPGTQFIVNQVRITDVNAELTLSAAGAKAHVEINVPEVLLEDVGAGSGGVDMSQLTALISTAILEAIMRSDGVPRAILTDLSSGLSGLTSANIELPEGVGSAVDKYQDGDNLGAAADIANEIDDPRAKDAAKVLEGARGLFGGPKED